MFKVKNKKTVNNLSIKSFTANKTRNIIAAAAIALTTVLFASLFTIGLGMVESVQYQTMRQTGSDGHIIFKYLTEEQYQKLSSHKLVKMASYNKLIADQVTNPAFLKRRLELYYMDDTAMQSTFCTPTTGNAPLLSNEIALDTASLDLLGVPHTLGSKITLSYRMGTEEFTTDFYLSGFWDSDVTFPVGYGLVSEEFTKMNAEALTYTYDKDHKYAGVITSYVMCQNSRNLQAKMEQIVQESGYTLLSDDSNIPPLKTDISCNTNWAYLNSRGTMSFGTIFAAIAAILLITFTGYLIIFNVFQISVLRDIRFYGLLKTIGTTGRQIKRIVTRQAMFLSIIGIPIGLIFGFVIGKAVLPMAMSISSVYQGAAVVSINPLIFIGASIFSLLTVFLSTRKPCRIATQVSPIEAVKYSSDNTVVRQTKQSKHGGKLYKMALSNLSRSKKRTIITILSLSLSLVLLNTVFTLINGFDMDKYLANYVDTDFLAGHANYFNMNQFRSTDDVASETMIAAIEAQDGFLEGGRLYFNPNLEFSVDQPIAADVVVHTTHTAKDGKPALMLYGLDPLPLSRINVYEGELDFEKLATGKYIIEGIETDEAGNFYTKTHYAIGDTAIINVDGKPHEYEVLAKMKISYYTNSARYSNSDYSLYLPSDEYKSIVRNPTVMSYAYNVKEGTDEQMEAFIKNYTNNIEETMNYDSKLTQIKSFESMQNMVVTIGGVLSGILGLIGLLNFANSIITGITTRRREFATLQSIGMTKSQLVQMLCLEGFYYAAMTVFAALIIGAIFSVVIFGGIMGSLLWMFSYHFTLIPILIVSPALLLLSVLIPYAAYHSAGRQSVVERLREAE